MFRPLVGSKNIFNYFQAKMSFKIMQKWQLEVGKMFLYMAFPVACFHYFNSPQIFEEAVTKIKLSTFPPTPVQTKGKVEAMIREINAERELKHLEELEARPAYKQNVS